MAATCRALMLLGAQEGAGNLLAGIFWSNPSCTQMTFRKAERCTRKNACKMMVHNTHWWCFVACSTNRITSLGRSSKAVNLLISTVQLGRPPDLSKEERSPGPTYHHPNQVGSKGRNPLCSVKHRKIFLMNVRRDGTLCKGEWRKGKKQSPACTRTVHTACTAPRQHSTGAEL